MTKLGFKTEAEQRAILTKQNVIEEADGKDQWAINFNVVEKGSSCDKHLSAKNREQIHERQILKEKNVNDLDFKTNDVYQDRIFLLQRAIGFDQEFHVPRDAHECRSPSMWKVVNNSF